MSLDVLRHTVAHEASSKVGAWLARRNDCTIRHKGIVGPLVRFPSATYYMIHIYIYTHIRISISLYRNDYLFVIYIYISMYQFTPHNLPWHIPTRPLHNPSQKLCQQAVIWLTTRLEVESRGRCREARSGKRILFLTTCVLWKCSWILDPAHEFECRITKLYAPLILMIVVAMSRSTYTLMEPCEISWTGLISSFSCPPRHTTPLGLPKCAPPGVHRWSWAGDVETTDTECFNFVT